MKVLALDGARQPWAHKWSQTSAKQGRRFASGVTGEVPANRRQIQAPLS